jgi:hypothetical protein
MEAETVAALPEDRPVWVVTCSCGWTRQASSAWTATALARLHARYLFGPDTIHDTIIIQESSGQPDRPRPS